MTEHKTANIEVYCDYYPDNDNVNVFALLSESDIPTVYDDYEIPSYMDAIDKWAKDTFSHFEKGDCDENAGTLVYEPNGGIIRIEKK